MYKIEEFVALLEEFAPLSISYKAIEKGDYDNSGLLIKSSENVSKILFSLDLTTAAVNEAKTMGADTTVTHHPAIYTPIKKMAIDGENAALIAAVELGLNVVSMHLNLDMSKNGIDQSLAEALGAKECKILDDLDGEYGYGREFICEKDLEEIKMDAQKNLQTDKIILYGNGKVKKVASFCGGGSSHAIAMVNSGKTDADLIVSSDIPHHVLEGLISQKRAVMIIPHYVAEQYGFNKFFKWAKERISGVAQAEYFIDKRFM
jgi:dinuclear metal center YbgI/SA1388 family protein